ncbi:hypothetical protein [Nocardia seriolae]|uniref:DUF4832 domain-containing protein n=1 Tax=Nocardia seriolae TaxID=37332 RepID=A0ABC8AS58_9NOCA|nr:hypothetical protein [Nocardia seriolae]APA96837.1 hypothetical protein NS506_02777 [Nocardia seriolae]QOW33884.1 hypothetical protein IMZ23_01600 [Nocardia seriolae]QUN18622.1 hypothetical protein KEC46_04135 [Nocardia seriolae]WNJ61087.1 hypothetical protein RMO66_10515 [Nocardia seriolae]
MRDRAGVTERSSLRVTVDFRDSAHRSLGVGWSVEAVPNSGDAARKFESARIFLVALGSRPCRTYLGLVDWQDRTSIQLPESVPAGAYAIDVDAYGSASWGDGRLDARGRSASFTVDLDAPE